MQALRGDDPELVRVVPIRPTHTPEDSEALIDGKGHAHRAYGIDDHENITFVVRPHGYVGHVAASGWRHAGQEYLARVAGAAIGSRSPAAC